MKLSLSEDQVLLTDSFRKFFQDESSMARVRAAEPLGFDPKLWAGLGEMGALAMRMPGEDGFGLFDAALVMEESGRQLASAPIAETMVGVRLLTELGDNSGIAQAASEGKSVLTLALHEAVPDAVQLIPGGAVAHAVLFLSGEEVRIAERTPDGKTRENLGYMPIGELVLTGKGAVSSRVVASGAKARRAYLAAIEEWKILTACALSELARRAIEMAADYAKDRIQFGRPIGSYQAIAHPLADVVTDVIGSRMLNWWAIRTIADGSPDAAAAVSMAWWWAAKSSGEAVAKSLHSFGGYGLTNEYDIQLYHRRAKAVALILGDPCDELLKAGRRLWLEQGGPVPEAGPLEIEFGLGAEAEAFAKETREFFDRTLTPEYHANSHFSYAGHNWDLHKAMGKEKLIYATWPKEHGGRGANSYVASAGMTVWDDYGVSSHAQGTSNMVGHMIINFGSDKVKREVIPRMAAGEIITSLGYSEPSSGSDVFAAKTKAVRDGDDWIINGQKIFTSGANLSSYVFLLTRTDPDAPKHKGITMFLVPLNSPGVEVHPIFTFMDERTNQTFYSDVRVSDEYRIGPVNGGLQALASALSLEQGGAGYIGPHRHVLDSALEWARKTKRNGKPVIEDPRVLERLARVAVRWQVSQVLYFRSLWLLEENLPGVRAAGPMSKLFASEGFLRDSTDLLDLAAPDTLFRGKYGLSVIELGHRHSAATTIYAGTSEIQRSQVAENELGLPKSR